MKDALAAYGLLKDNGPRNQHRPTPHASPTANTPFPQGPQPEGLPSPAWQARAEAIAVEANRILIDGKNRAGVLYAKDRRHLSDDTLKQYHIGWLAADRWDDRTKWGLPEDKEKPNIFLPRGLVLPILRKGRVVELLIRCADYGENPQRNKYHQITAGEGCRDYVFAAGREGQPVIVVESMIDALLLRQFSNGLYAVMALNGINKGTKSDGRLSLSAEVMQFLSAAPAIIVNADNDEAGRQGINRWLRTGLKNIFPLVCHNGKDVGEMLDHAQDIASWAIAGILKAMPSFQQTLDEYFEQKNGNV